MLPDITNDPTLFSESRWFARYYSEYIKSPDLILDLKKDKGFQVSFDSKRWQPFEVVFFNEQVVSSYPHSISLANSFALMFQKDIVVIPVEFNKFRETSSTKAFVLWKEL